ncbi:abnormal spindle-like microcephaly-associated protein homolog isoform X1 [Asparagus officinalis]|nr:abnormal spindle-like microcephaly-associated protein homolog isoform X1 [Asparagus officinalis]
MERRRRPEPPPTPPPPIPPSSPFLHDISNFKTPLLYSRNPNPEPNPNPNPNPNSSPLFFTASKNSPSSSRSSIRRRPFTPSIPQSKATRRLKALELEQSKSARKAESHKAKALKSFARSVTAWLNFLFENPKECGCEIGMGSDEGRGWKRQKSSDEEEDLGVVLSVEKVSALRESLKDVCSLDDLRARMVEYMSKKGCNEVLSVMSRLCKNIDEGRLKMKAHCPIVTDMALREKSTRVLMCYNPTWLRIGLYIIFGGDSLLNEGGTSDQEDAFLKLIIENQFFTHMVIARSYAYNKLVGGLYRPGFFEALGSIILKRFLLLVISLDKAKCESTLPLKCGIDGIDGGSPLLFSRHSHMKSSKQTVQAFLSEAMHGEGDLISHLVILGCKLNYHQFPLAEYEFKLSNLFEDLQDGIVLSRVIQLLKCNASILSKVIVPSDSHKKRLQNCNTALQYLKQTGVSLSDEDGIQITPEDIVNGDKELALSILWNIFVYLQVPLLIDKTLLAKEIAKVQGSDLELPHDEMNSELDLLLSWIKAVCKKQGMDVDSFSSAIEGKAFCCLIDYYFRNKVQYGDESIMNFDAATAEKVHNFAFVHSIYAILGNFPKVFQLCDMLDQDASYDERSIVIFLVFLASRLTYRKTGGNLVYKSARRSYRYTDSRSSMVPQTPFPRNTLFSNNKFKGKKFLEFVSPQKKSGLNKEHAAIIIQSYFKRFAARKKFLKIPIAACLQERAASVIQSHYRGYTERRKFIKITMAACLVQVAVRAWLSVTSKGKLRTVKLVWPVNRLAYGSCDGYLQFMIERHTFLRIKKSALLIQQASRAWIKQWHQRRESATLEFIKSSDSIAALTTIQSFIRGQIARARYAKLFNIIEKQQHSSPEMEDHEQQCQAATKLQSAWKNFAIHSLDKQKKSSAVRIQSCWRGWYLRKNFLRLVAAVINIQAVARCVTSQKTFSQYRFAAIEFQRFARGHIARKRLLGASYLHYGTPCFGSYSMTNNYQNLELKRKINSILVLQRWWKHLLLSRARTGSAILIQSCIRGWSARRTTRKKRNSISTIQRWWRNILIIRSRTKSVILIQTHIRGWIARRAAERVKRNIIIIQSYWKGYVARKYSWERVANLRIRLQECSVNVDDNKRLINRLVAALSELLGYKSVSNIRHTCATLNTATELSQLCCETLVSAGAVDILLKQFHSLNRGIPDQEVLKHVVSTLRNISRYPQLLQVLIDTPQAIEIIFQEFLRNKSDVFFVIYELLERFCTTQDGLKSICQLHGHVRKLSNLVRDLERKSELQKRNPRLWTVKDNTVRRLRAAATLMLLISGHQ